MFDPTTDGPIAAFLAGGPVGDPLNELHAPYCNGDHCGPGPEFCNEINRPPVDTITA